MVYDPPLIHERQQVGEPHPDMTSVVDHFDSLEEFLQTLKRQEHLFDDLPKNQRTKRGSEFNIRQMYVGQDPKGKLHFNMCETFDDAVRLAEYGWPEGRERVAAKQAEIRNLMRDMIEAPSFFHDHIGEEVDVAEFLQGTPEHMIGYDVVQTRHKFLRITVDVNCRCDQCGRRSHDAEPNPPEWAMVRGAVVSLLVQALIRYGFEVEVVVGAVAQYPMASVSAPNASGFSFAELPKPYKHTTMVTIHRPGWQFDFDKLVFCTAHEAFTRKLLFRYDEGWVTERADRKINYKWEAGDPAVGYLSLYDANLPKHMPEMGLSDIHIDSFPVLTNRLGETDKGRDYGDRIRRRKAGQRYANNTFATVLAGAQYLLERLREVGVVFR